MNEINQTVGFYINNSKLETKTKLLKLTHSPPNTLNLNFEYMNLEVKAALTKAQSKPQKVLILISSRFDRANLSPAPIFA